MCSNSCILCLKQSHFWLAVTSIHITYFHNFGTTTTQLFYGPFSETTQWAGARREISGLYGARED